MKLAYLACLVSCLASACHFGSRQRSLGTLEVRDWQLEVVCYEHLFETSRDFVPIDDWTLRPVLYVRHGAEEPRDMGALWAASEEDQHDNLDPLFEKMRFVSCSLPDGRIAFRVEAEVESSKFSLETAWWLAYANPKSFAVADRQVEAKSCESALAQHDPLPTWVARELKTTPEFEVNHPLTRIHRLAMPGRSVDDLPQDPAVPVALAEGLSFGTVLRQAVLDDAFARDLLLDDGEFTTLGRPRLAPERAILLERLAKGGLGERSPGLEALALVTPARGQGPFPVHSSDELRIGFEWRVLWMVRLARAVPAGEERTRAVRAIIDGCKRPETRAACSPLATWTVATLARDAKDNALCDEVLRLVPDLVRARVSALEWTALGALRGVGQCGTPSVRASAAAASLAPVMPVLSAEERDPISEPQHESIDISPQECRLDLDPLDLDQCLSLPGFARAVLEESCGAEGIAAARAAVRLAQEEDWVIRGQARCVLARCAPALLGKLDAEDEEELACPEPAR